MSQLSIPLNPVANPTNQFVAPRIQQPNGQAASDLAQLSNSLAKVTPEIMNVLQSQQQAGDEGAQARANQDFLQKRYENTAALKKAVDDGQVAEADNPWYITQLHQDVAANEAADQVRQMNVDWENSPVRFSDNPEDVENWAKQQLAPVTDGKDVYESEAIAPVVQQGISSLLSHHMEVRQSEREQDRVANFQQRVANVLGGSDPKANAQQLQSLIGEARMTMTGSQVNALVIKAAGDQAEATGDESVLSILNSVPNSGAGGTLADAPEVKHLQQQLPLMRMRRSMEIDEMLQRQQKQQQEASKQNLLANLMQASGNRPEKVQITPDLAAKWGIPFEDVIDTNEKAMNYGKAIDDQSDQQAVRVDKANARIATQIQGQVSAGIASGQMKITDPQVTDARTRIAGLSPANLNEFDRFLYDTYEMQGRQKDVFARDSDPTTYANLWTAAKNNTLTTSQLIPQAGKLSHEDWTRLFQETIKTDPSTKVSDFPMSKYDDLLKDMVVSPRASDFGDSTDLAAKDPNVSYNVLKAQTKFVEVTQSLLNDPTFSKLPRDQQTTRLRQVLDSTAQEFGGVTDAQRQKQVAENAKAAQAATQQATEKMNGGVTFHDGQGTTPDGQTFGTATELSDAMRAQVRSVANAVRPNDGTASLDMLYSGTDTRSLWQKLTFQHPDNVHSTDEVLLGAYVHNAGLLNAGNLGFWQAARVVNNDTGFYTTPDGGHTDVQTAARLNFMQQRQALADTRRRIGAGWINPSNKDELLKLTAELSGGVSGKQTLPQSKVDRFNELSDKFRMYDFLGVTAGVDRSDIERDYRVLYKYPAAGSIDEFNRMAPFLVTHIPPSEFQAVQKAQRSLIDNAHDLLINRKYVP